MNPVAIRLRGYRTFDSLDLDLPEGCVGVLGLNGAGKSSIVGAIDLGLFGPDGRSWLPYLQLGADTLMIEVTFEHDGQTYRVRRGWRGKATLDLEKRWNSETENGRGLTASSAHAAGWEPLTLATMDETQALIEKIVGFSRTTLRASSLLLQGDGAAFSEASPRDRKRILADTLGLDRFERFLAAARTDRRAVEREAAMIDGRLAGVTADRLQHERQELQFSLRALEGEIVKVEATVASVEAALEEVAEALRSAQALAGERATAAARRDAAVAAHEAKAKLREDALAAASAAAEINTQLEGLPTSEQLDALQEREQALMLAVERHAEARRVHDDTVRLHELRVTERDTIYRQADSVAQKIAELDEKISLIRHGSLDECPTCGQELGSVARADTISSLRAQATAYEVERDALRERADAIEIPDWPEPAVIDPTTAEGLNAVRLELREAREAAVRRGTLMGQLEGHARTLTEASSAEYLAELDRLAAVRQEAEDALAALPELPDTGPLQESAATTKLRVDEERARLEQLRRDKAVQAERLDQLDQRIEQHTADLQERERLSRQAAVLVDVERAFSPDGIPAALVELLAIPMIEVEANRILTMLGGTTAGCRVELRTGRAKADGGIRDDVLDITVITDAGEREYGTFSGGERTRLNLALRIALARLLATRRGAESRILCIDEPEYLDADGTAALVEVLQDLERAGVFDKLLLVSHVPDLRDAFDQTITVVKENGRSRIAGAEIEAAVA